MYGLRATLLIRVLCNMMDDKKLHIRGGAVIELTANSMGPTVCQVVNCIKRSLETRVREKTVPSHPLLNRSLLE